MKILSRLHKQGGTSLLEMLVALAITGVVTLAIFRTYIIQHKQYVLLLMSCLVTYVWPGIICLREYRLL